MVLADMPGYGFAYAHEKQREDWKGLVSPPPPLHFLLFFLFLQLSGWWATRRTQWLPLLFDHLPHIFLPLWRRDSHPCYVHRQQRSCAFYALFSVLQRCTRIARGGDWASAVWR